MAVLTGILKTAYSLLSTENSSGQSFSAGTTQTLSYALVVPDNIKSVTSVINSNTSGSFVTLALYSWTDDSHALQWRIMSGTTVLVANDSAGSFAGNIYTSQTSTAQGTFFRATNFGGTLYINTAADQTLWNNATLELHQAYSNNMGGDGAYYTLDYFEVHIQYEPTVQYVAVGQAVEGDVAPKLTRSSPKLRVRLDSAPVPPNRFNHQIVAHARTVHPTTLRLVQGETLVEEWSLAPSMEYQRYELDLTAYTANHDVSTSQLLSNSTTSAVDTSPRGQSFTVPAGMTSISRISVHANANSVEISEMLLQVRSELGTGTSFAARDSVGVIASQPRAEGAAPDTAGWHHFDFDPGDLVDLVEGEVLYFVIGVGSSSQIGLSVQTSDVYAGGTAWHWNISNGWVLWSTADLMFEVLGGVPPPGAADQITDYSNLYIEVVSGEPTDGPLLDGTQIASLQFVTPGTAETLVAVGKATELNAANPTVFVGGASIAQATSTEVARRITTIGVTVVQQALESNFARSFGATVIEPLLRSASSETATIITPIKGVAVTTAVQTESSVQIGSTHRKAIGRADEVNVSMIRPLLPKFLIVGQATSSERARRIYGTVPTVHLWDGNDFIEGVPMVYIDGEYVPALVVWTWNGTQWLESV